MNGGLELFLEIADAGTGMCLVSEGEKQRCSGLDENSGIVEIVGDVQEHGILWRRDEVSFLSFPDERRDGSCRETCVRHTYSSGRRHASSVKYD